MNNYVVNGLYLGRSNTNYGQTFRCVFVGKEVVVMKNLTTSKEVTTKLSTMGAFVEWDRKPVEKFYNHYDNGNITGPFLTKEEADLEFDHIRKDNPNHVRLMWTKVAPKTYNTMIDRQAA
jgi:hypothetical protein